MPKDTEKYQYFTVGLLKSSFALEALKADAMKHHMIEQPAKLIALRLTEYYDLLARVGPPMPNVSLFTANRPEMGNGSRANSVIERDGQFVHATDDEIATLPVMSVRKKLSLYLLMRNRMLTWLQIIGLSCRSEHHAIALIYMSSPHGGKRLLILLLIMDVGYITTRMFLLPL